MVLMILFLYLTFTSFRMRLFVVEIHVFQLDLSPVLYEQNGLNQ